MDSKMILMVLVAIVLGMIVYNMLNDVCGCKNLIEGQCTDPDNCAIVNGCIVDGPTTNPVISQTPIPIVANGPVVVGNVSGEGQIINYAFQAEVGKTYGVEVSIPDSNQNPDADSWLYINGILDNISISTMTQECINTDGYNIDECFFNDDDERLGASEYGSYIDFTPTETKTYYATVGSWDGDLGDFTITITEITDDSSGADGGHDGSGSDTQGDIGILNVGTTTTEASSYGDDAYYVLKKFNAEEGKTYNFQVTPPEGLDATLYIYAASNTEEAITRSGTLYSADLNADATVCDDCCADAGDYLRCEGYEQEPISISFAPQSPGDYYILVIDVFDDEITGDFTITITDVTSSAESCDDAESNHNLCQAVSKYLSDGADTAQCPSTGCTEDDCCGDQYSVPNNSWFSTGNKRTFNEYKASTYYCGDEPKRRGGMNGYTLSTGDTVHFQFPANVDSNPLSDEEVAIRKQTECKTWCDPAAENIDPTLCAACCENPGGGH
jgi:hypothetical protein